MWYGKTIEVGGDIWPAREDGKALLRYCHRNHPTDFGCDYCNAEEMDFQRFGASMRKEVEKRLGYFAIKDEYYTSPHIPQEAWDELSKVQEEFEPSMADVRAH